MSTSLRTTPYHTFHVANDGKIVPFAGWEMPVQFPGGILHEHRVVRQGAGVFDVSHMGRFFIRGENAIGFTNYLITNNLEKLSEGALLYSALCNEKGGIIDDVTVYHLGDAALLVANAANADAVEAWMRQHAPEGITIENATDAYAQIALQGPKAEAALAEPFASAVREVGYYEYTFVEWQGERVLISRNGYTGEDGFEIYVPAQVAVALWEALFEWGEAVGIEPIGLGARDSLRMEVNYALYGNELSTETTPLEAGLRWVVKLKKGGDFIGRDALLAQKEAGLERTLVGFEVEGKRLPRHGYPIVEDGRQVGFVTSGGFCPSLEKGMGMAYVPVAMKAEGTELSIDARGRTILARVVERPFYKDGSVKK